MEKETMKERALALIPEKVNLVYTDYRDDLSGQTSVIAKCMKCGSAVHLIESSFYWYEDAYRDGVNHVIDELREDLLKEFDWMDVANFIHDEHEWLDDVIRDRDECDPILECLGRTNVRARIELMSNWESYTPLHISRTFSMEDYNNEMTKRLHLNPAKVKEALEKRGIECQGRFDKRPNREGKEVVSYDDFASMIEDTPCYSRMAFLGAAPLVEMYKKDFRLGKITIPKGTKLLMYNSWNGSGSIEIETINPVTIDLRWEGKTKYDHWSLILDVDEKNGGSGYDTDSVYGWGCRFEELFSIA